MVILFISLNPYMMKKRLLEVVLSLCILALVGCGNNPEVANEVDENEVNENAALEQAVQDCIDKWWTHSLIHSQTAVYGECSFPSGVICDDDLLRSWECQYEVDLSKIDTEEKRIEGCEETASNYIRDIERGKAVSFDWEDEEEAWASFVRNWTVKYSKWWDNRKITVECIADFVDWSITVSESSYDPSDINEVDEENGEDEDVVEENENEEEEVEDEIEE